MSDLHELQKKIVAFRDARDWAQFHNPKDFAISLALEAAEVLESTPGAREVAVIYSYAIGVVGEVDERVVVV